MTISLTRRAAASMLAFGPALLGRGAGAAEPPKDPPVFRIGALLGLTDKGNWNATVMQRGIMMAVDEINAKGGIDGIKVEAAIEDHQGVPRVGVDALERLRARYDIQAVLLSYSTVALATAPICEQNKIFMLDGGSVSEALVGKFSYLFHNRAVATVLARAALTIPKQQGFKKMAVMAASTDEGQSLLRLSRADWEAYGGTIVDVEQALATASNIDTQIAKLTHQRGGLPGDLGILAWSWPGAETRAGVRHEAADHWRRIHCGGWQGRRAICRRIPNCVGLLQFGFDRRMAEAICCQLQGQIR